MAPVYVREIDRRFVPVVEHLIARADLRPGLHVLDLGTGTGSVALRVAPEVAPDGHVTAVDISPEMLVLARHALSKRLGPTSVLTRGVRRRCQLRLKASTSSWRAFPSCTRSTGPRPRARSHEFCDPLVSWWPPSGRDRSTRTSCGCRRRPPALRRSPLFPGVGPGALADLAPFLGQLSQAGVEARVETEITEFDFDDFGSAWDVLVGVTAARLEPGRTEEAKSAVRALMWPDGDGARRFRNETRFIVGRRRPHQGPGI